jgi:serine/threonine protein kinase
LYDYNPYPQYDRCDRHNPLGCDRALVTLKTAPMAKFCSKCGFPAPLPVNKEIRGKKGTYQITSLPLRQNNGRIYQAIQQNNGREVIVKEYLLPRRYFASSVIQQKQEIFNRVANFQVAATIPSDFRLIVPQEGISDDDRDRCYLIAPDNLAALPSLKDYLIQQGRMETEEVIQLLEQVLQSLEFLHSHRWKFTSGEIRSGIIHGNLSLDTLLIQQTEMSFFSLSLGSRGLGRTIFTP